MGNVSAIFSVCEREHIYMLPLRKVYSRLLVPEDKIGVPARGWAVRHILKRVNHAEFWLQNPT